jgi:hypothetical protein
MGLNGILANIGANRVAENHGGVLRKIAGIRGLHEAPEERANGKRMDFELVYSSSLISRKRV